MEDLYRLTLFDKFTAFKRCRPDGLTIVTFSLTILRSTCLSFVIRSFFFEKWLLTHFLPCPEFKNPPASFACIGFLTF